MFVIILLLLFLVFLLLCLPLLLFLLFLFLFSSKTKSYYVSQDGLKLTLQPPKFCSCSYEVFNRFLKHSRVALNTITLLPSVATIHPENNFFNSPN